MRRTFLAFLTLAMLTVMVAPAVSAVTAAQRHREVALSGAIARVGDDGIVLRTREHGLVAVGVIDRTQITLNGERADLADLHAGDHARVAAVLIHGDRGPRLIARIIAAHRRR